VAGALLGVLLPWLDAVAAATPTFVQARAKEVRSGTTSSLAFTSANTAGNLVVVYVLWSNAGSVSVSDSRGNGYASAVARVTWKSNWSAQVLYAKNVAGGTNTVTATFATAINSFADIYIHEYSGVDKVNPVDVARSATGTSSTVDSGPVTMTNATDLLFAAAASSGSVNQGGTGYTTRSTAFGNRTQDRNVTTAGSYNATATQSSSSWVMQLVAFRADNAADPTAPTVAVTAPTAGTTVSGAVTVAASASDNVGVTGVQFLLDGTNLGAEDTTSPYSVPWDTTASTDGSHTLTARARDGAGNTALSAPVTVNVANADHFQNEVLATGFDLPTSIEFLIFYTLGTPNRDRLSRLTANATLTGTVAGSETVLYQDALDANAEHHGGAVSFGNDGKLYFTTGEHFNADDAPLLTSPRERSTASTRTAPSRRTTRSTTGPDRSRSRSIRRRWISPSTRRRAASRSISTASPARRHSSATLWSASSTRSRRVARPPPRPRTPSSHGLTGVPGSTPSRCRARRRPTPRPFTGSPVVLASPTFAQVQSATPQTAQSVVATTFTQAQTAGNLNAVVIGWNEPTGDITSVRDSAGNVYQVAAPTTHGSRTSQAIYYARTIMGAAAGNTVTVTFDKAVAYADIRVLEYSGLDPTNPLDVSSSAVGSASTASSGTATTSFASELLLGAGTTSGGFSGAGAGFTVRIITSPDADIAEDRTVTSSGAYSAAAPQGGTWVMQLATFKAAGQ
jgi:hypothetical protein